MAHLTQTELARRLADAGRQVTVGARYCHYKDTDQAYTVTGLVIMEADDSVGVVYRAEYGQRVSFVRPLASWLATVELAGRQVSRFRPVD